MQLLRQEARELGYKPQFSILDAADAGKIVSDIVASTDKQEIRRVQNAISRWKNALIGPQTALAQADNDLDLTAARLPELSGHAVCLPGDGF